MPDGNVNGEGPVFRRKRGRVGQFDTFVIFSPSVVSPKVDRVRGTVSWKWGSPATVAVAV